LFEKKHIIIFEKLNNNVLYQQGKKTRCVLKYLLGSIEQKNKTMNLIYAV